jgi:hypothetical protein
VGGCLGGKKSSFVVFGWVGGSFMDCLAKKGKVSRFA